MAVLLQTSLGDIVIDLYTNYSPKASMNFLKLCKLKHYNNALFSCVQKDYLTSITTVNQDISVFGLMAGEEFHYFEDEICPELRHDRIGIVSMSNKGPDMNASNVRLTQFFITLTASGESFDKKHTIFGIVEEGLHILSNINLAICDENSRPYRDIRIKHTYLLDDPFEDLPNMVFPASPEPIQESDRLLDDEQVDETFNAEEIKEHIQEHEAKIRAVTLEMIGDLPDADIKPPENVAFVCKLHQVTNDQDLYLLFSRFGPINSCQVVRDYKTGNSLQYAFIEFQNVRDCEEAVLRMDGVLVDRKRIKVDFSQSVSKIWNKHRRARRARESNNHIKIKPTINELKLEKDRHKLVFEFQDLPKKRNNN